MPEMPCPQSTPHSDHRIRRRLLAAGCAAAVLAGAGCSTGAKAEGQPTTTRRATTTAPTSTTEATTTTVPAPVKVTPLTGIPTDEATATRLFRPALAVKIDNSQDAMPQEGLNQADVVFEIKVEGISRLMAVFHSQDAGEIGPTRSARYSDPPILALLGKPLFAWSGANDGVSEDVYHSPWVYNVNWDRVANSDYYRKPGRKAPHNLYTSTDKLYAYAKPEQGPPLQMFQYLEPGQGNAGAVPLPGMTESVGDTPSAWVWDGSTGQYLRWQYGRRDQTQGSGQANATNVVILEIRYKGSAKAPIAVSEGSGRALVLSGGTLTEGTWNRPDQLHPIALIGADGQPIRLQPGRTWVELTPGSTARPMAPEQAASLISGP